MTLWVDVDDTLVIYDDTESVTHPYGTYNGTPWTANEPLLAGIRKFLEDQPNSLVVIWSGGGILYANEWRTRLLPGLDVSSLGKNPQTASLIRPGDIVVDDYVDFRCPVKVYGPHEWPERKE